MAEPFKIELPPGLVRGLQSDYAVAGRYYDARNWRWVREGGLLVSRPMKGWEIAFPGAHIISGIARSAHAWVDDDEAPWGLIGTNAKVYAHDGTTLSDATPVGYGPASADTCQITIDNFGELGVLCNDEDNLIYEYQPGGGGVMTQVTNAPTARAIFSTEEKFLFALQYNLDPRAFGWCDQANRTVWTATALNSAGDLPIQEIGALMCGGKIKGGALLHTTTGVHFVNFEGRPDVYSAEHVANGCGIISRNGGISVGSRRFWMGDGQFHAFAGAHAVMDCDIGDDVFGNINMDHAHKVWAFRRSKFNEIWFPYPRGNETECSHAAIYNYKDNFWNHTERPRTAGFDVEPFGYPVEISPESVIFKHETGWDYDDTVLLTTDDGADILTTDDGATRLTSDEASDATAMTPYARSGPVEIGDGGRRMQIDEIWPDEQNQGGCETYILAREHPNATLTTLGPYSSADRMGIFTTARQVSIEHRAASGTEDFRIGVFRAVLGPARGRH